MKEKGKKGGMSVNNVIGFIWAVFSGIITLRLANPLYNTIFGLDWGFSFTARMSKYGLMIIFGVIMFGAIFYIPFRVFTEVYEGVERGEGEKYYNG